MMQCLISLPEQLYFYPNNIRILTDDQRDQYQNLPTEANIVSHPYRLLRPLPDLCRSAGWDALVGRGRPIR
jgi:hypothetical protein